MMGSVGQSQEHPSMVLLCYQGFFVFVFLINLFVNDYVDYRKTSCVIFLKLENTTINHIGSWCHFFFFLII